MRLGETYNGEVTQVLATCNVFDREKLVEVPYHVGSHSQCLTISGNDRNRTCEVTLSIATIKILLMSLVG